MVVDTLGELSAKGLVKGVTADTFKETLLNHPSYAVGIYPEYEELFEWVCDAAAAREDITLAIDEIDMWLPSAVHAPPQSLLNMSLTGGHYAQTLICVTHRPVSIHHSIMSQGVLWVFPMFDTGDRKKVIDYTSRPNCPGGIDPADLEVLDRNEHGWIQAVQVARVSHEEVKVLAFDLRTGSLTE